MNTIKIYLTESGRVADLRKDFPLFKGQFQNKLLNVLVPTSILAPMYSIQHYIGQISGATEPIAETLNTFVMEHTYPARGSEIGDVIEWHDTENDLFYTFVFSDGDTWQKTQVDSFGTLNSIAGTSVKIGMTGVERNGKIYTSKSYFMRYLKTMVYQGTEYALYERKLPKEFTAISGQGTNAPILTINVVNVDTQNNAILSIVTSQTCSLDVMPSTILDQDTAIEPTEFENLTAQLNTITATLDLKQNKEDPLLDTQNDNVVGAINEVNQRSTINSQHIEENRQDIAKNRNDIDFLIENMQLSDEYLGQITGETLPTQEQLTNYVQTHEGRVPKSGDVIIFILTIPDATDKNYKYYFTARGWEGYEIPPMESASNDTLGLIEGTYGVGLDYDVLFDISGGQILHIYIKNNLGIYVDLKDYIAELNQNVEDIISGDMPVGEALKAISDGLGNNITETYLTKNIGATKQYVRDYSLPREFNDVYYLSSDGTEYYKNVSTHTSEVTTNAVGDFLIYGARLVNDAEFELSSKNGYSNTIYLSADVDTTVSFRMTTNHGKYLGADTPYFYTTLNVELTPPIKLTAGEIQKITLGSPFLYLEDKVLNVTENDIITQALAVVTQSSTPTTFTLYSTSTYPTMFNLTTQSYTLSAVEENIGKTIFLGADGIIEAGNVVFTVANHESYEEFLTNQREFILTAHLPLVGLVDDSAVVRITFGDTVYNVYSFMKGGDTPLTFGELKSVLSYDQNIGYNLYLNVIFLDTSDIKGFAINPAVITPATNTDIGIVKGSTTDGQISVNNDNTMALNGYDSIISRLDALDGNVYEKLQITLSNFYNDGEDNLPYPNVAEMQQIFNACLNKQDFQLSYSDGENGIVSFISLTYDYMSIDVGVSVINTVLVLAVDAGYPRSASERAVKFIYVNGVTSTSSEQFTNVSVDNVQSIPKINTTLVAEDSVSVEKFGGVTSLSANQYDTLYTNGSINVSGTTLPYNNATLYVTPKNDFKSIEFTQTGQVLTSTTSTTGHILVLIEFDTEGVHYGADFVLHPYDGSMCLVSYRFLNYDGTAFLDENGLVNVNIPDGLAFTNVKAHYIRLGG